MSDKVPFHVLSRCSRACGLPISLSDPRRSHLTSLFEAFSVSGLRLCGCMCFIYRSIHSLLKSRHRICGAQSSRGDSCLCRCWNRHVYRQRSHGVQSRIMSRAHSGLVKVTGSPLAICMVPVSHIETMRHYSPSGGVRFCINGRHADKTWQKYIFSSHLKNELCEPKFV